MRGFIISIISLALIISAVALYGQAWQRETEELRECVNACLGEAGEETKRAIQKSIELLEEKRVFLHMTLKQSRIDSLHATLNAAYVYCAEGDTKEMRRCIYQAAKEIGEWHEAEKISLWTVS